MLWIALWKSCVSTEKLRLLCWMCKIRCCSVISTFSAERFQAMQSQATRTTWPDTWWRKMTQAEVQGAEQFRSPTMLSRHLSTPTKGLGMLLRGMWLNRMVRNRGCVCWVKLEAVALPQQLEKGVPVSEGDILPYQHLLIAAPALWSKATEPGSSKMGYHKPGAGHGQAVQVVWVVYLLGDISGDRDCHTEEQQWPWCLCNDCSLPLNMLPSPPAILLPSQGGIINGRTELLPLDGVSSSLLGPLLKNRACGGGKR